MQTSRGDSSAHPKNDDCHALTPLVMALFDGETDELETRRARAHLLVCQTCANRWLDWNHSRDLLRVPPAPPPPMLLWRVLMACRLAEFSRHTPSKNSGFAARRRSIQIQSEAPTALSSQILARTTRNPATQTAQQPRRNSSVFSLLRMPFLAAPALAVLLITLQNDAPWSPAVAPELETSRRAFPAPAHSEKTPRRAAKFQRPAIIARAESALPAISTAQKKESSAAPRDNLASAESKGRADVLAEADFSNVETAAPRVQQVSLNSHRFISSFDAKRFENLESTKNESAAPRRASAEIGGEVAQSRATVLPAASGKTELRRAEFALSAPDRTPNLRAAAWKNGAAPGDESFAGNASSSAAFSRAARVKRRTGFRSSGAPQILRVSLPTSEQSAVPAAQLLSDNFETDDNRVEEMRSVVDDFRATIAPDDTFSSEDDESFN